MVSLQHNANIIVCICADLDWCRRNDAIHCAAMLLHIINHYAVADDIRNSRKRICFQRCHTMSAFRTPAALGQRNIAKLFRIHRIAERIEIVQNLCHQVCIALGKLVSCQFCHRLHITQFSLIFMDSLRCVNRIFDFRGGTCILREHRPIPAEVGRFLSAFLSGHVPAACAFPRFDLARRIAVQFARITLALAELL